MQKTARILKPSMLCSLSICPQEGYSFSPIIPEPTISIHPSNNISPIPQTRHIPKLSISVQQTVSLPPTAPSTPHYMTKYLLEPSSNQEPSVGKPQPAPDPHQCQVCEKMLETGDDVKWHYETRYGREDCAILKNMLGTPYYNM